MIWLGDDMECNTTQPPWSFSIHREETTTSQTIGVTCLVIIAATLLIHVPSCYLILTQQELRAKMANRIKLAEDMYEVVALAAYMVALTYNLFSSGHSRLPVGWFIFLWNISTFIHLMPAGSRFIAIVFPYQYKAIFTPKLTTVYILTFFILAVTKCGVFIMCGVGICALNEGGVIITAPTPAVITTYVAVSIAITTIVVVMLILVYVIIIYNLMKFKHIFYEVIPLQVMAKHDGPGEEGENSKEVVRGQIRSSLKKTMLRQLKNKLPVYFITVTLANVTKLVYGGMINYLVEFKLAWDLYSLIFVTTAFTNAVGLLMVSKEMRSIYVTFMTRGKKCQQAV